MADYKFSNMKQINRYLDGKLREVLDYCAWRTERKLYELVENNVYSFDTKVYDRTMELLNSITRSELIKVHNTYYVEIYYDTDKIRSYPRDYPLWGQHTSFDGDDVSDWIPLWIEDGTKNKYYSHKGTHNVDECKEWISKEFNRLFTMMLTSYGLIVE